METSCWSQFSKENNKSPYDNLNNKFLFFYCFFAQKGVDVKDEEVRVVEARLLPMLEALDVLRKTGPEADEFHKHSKRDFGHLFVAIYYYWKCF